MSKILCDEKGRVVLPKDVRERYGGEFYVVPTIDDVVLIPVSKNPLSELGSIGRSAGFARKSLASLKKGLREQAAREL